MYYRYIKAFFLFEVYFICWSCFASNPFLRPGSNRPQAPVAPPPPPKPAPNPALANEVEFRGYFLLKGIPHFCIFNKKANVGEWIKLTEQTHEEFQAQAFDLESETLTLAFNGQDFTLTLQQSKFSQGLPNSSTALPKVNLPPRISSVGNKKVMPPKPKTSPKVPDWLANRISSRPSSFSSGSGIPSGFPAPSGTNFTGTRSSRFAPPPRTSSSLPNEIADSMGSSSPSSTTRTLSSPSAASFGGSPSTSLNSSPGVPSGDVTAPGVGSPPPADPQQDNNPNDNTQSELDDLPPPPPPPNILPPSPPPDILPTLDE